MSTPTTTAAPSIEIPRLPDETPRAYAARVEYLTMGAGRSLEKLRGQSGGRSGVPLRLATLEEWSSRYGWQRHAQQYDETLAALSAQRHAAEYDAALAEHRAKVLAKTASLSKLLDGLEGQIHRALSGQAVEGKDGKMYYIPKMDIEVSAITALMRGRLMVADMEAHALDIPRLRAALEALEGDDDA